MKSNNAPKSGGANKKMKKFPSLKSYLELYHKDVLAIFDDLGMLGSLVPRRGGSITLLIPDSSLIKEINKLIISDEPEKATDMVSSLVLVDYLPTPKDFEEKKDDIPTLLGKKLLYKSATASEVKIEDGVLTPTKFIPFSRQGKAKRDNLAVWLLKGKVEYEKAPPATYKNTGKKVEVRGGSEADSEMRALREALKRDKFLKMNAGICPFKNAIIRVLNAALMKGDEAFLDLARNLFTLNSVIDFYILFSNPLAFPYPKVLAYYKESANYTDKDSYEELLTSQESYSENSTEQMMASLSVATPLKIKEAYEKMDRGETSAYDPRFNEATLALFRKNKGLHLMIDEFSYIMFTALAHDVDKTNSAEALMNLLADMEMAYDADKAGVFTSPTRKTRLDKEVTYKEMRREVLDQFVKYFLMTYFMHRYNKASHREVFTRGGNEGLIDVDGYNRDRTSAYSCQTCVSGGALAELKAYMRANGGKLPEELN